MVLVLNNKESCFSIPCSLSGTVTWRICLPFSIYNFETDYFIKRSKTNKIHLFFIHFLFQVAGDCQTITKILDTWRSLGGEAERSSCKLQAVITIVLLPPKVTNSNPPPAPVNPLTPRSKEALDLVRAPPRCIIITKNHLSLVNCSFVCSIWC